MKNKIIIAAAVTAGTALITYLVRRRRAANSSPSMIPGQRSHHRTNVFANAKDHR